MTASKILMVFSDTGGGHRSATEAVYAAMAEILHGSGLSDQFVIISENVAEKTHPINRALVEIYNFLLRHSQFTMRYYYWLLHVLKPNDTELGYMLAGPYIRKLLCDNLPNVVVSIHPMLNHYFARAIKDCGLSNRTKLITVVTDPNDKLWKGWACPQSDITIVPNQAAFERLLSWGVPQDRMRLVGMPIHPYFTKPAVVAKEEFRRVLALASDRFTVCINAGWAGGGNMMAVYRALESVRRPIQVLFLCGHNQRLYKKALERAALSAIPTAVLPFHDDMSDLMNAVDLMVTKAGGLTTFEAIARRLPMAIDMITDPMPQEAGTVEILLQAGLAKPIRKPEDIAQIVEECQMIPDREKTDLPTLQNLNSVNAVYDIARIIFEKALAPNTESYGHVKKRMFRYGTVSGASKNIYG